MKFKEKKKILDRLKAKGVLSNKSYETKCKELTSKIESENEELENSVNQNEFSLILLKNGLFRLD